MLRMKENREYLVKKYQSKWTFEKKKWRNYWKTKENGGRIRQKRKKLNKGNKSIKIKMKEKINKIKVHI